MTILGIDIGSSAVNAGILRGPRIVGRIERWSFETKYDGVRAEIAPSSILGAIQVAVSRLGRRARHVDLIALSVMSPAWVAIDARGRALTPIVTHQDRRSVEIAREIERRVGKSRHLRLAGNRPFPGGISSTTCAWFLRHAPAVMRRADLVGHLHTFLHRRLTGERLIDPSNASFTGLYSTLTLRGWNDELCDAVGVSRLLLPEVRDASEIGGRLTIRAAHRLGLTQGTLLLVGITDTSSAMLLAGARPGQLLNVSGSTDVLALCTDRPRPDEHLLTRALGVGRLWMCVSTLAAAGSALQWAKGQFFADMTRRQFFQLVGRLSRRCETGGVTFEPYLAGERTSIEQRAASFAGLTLATTRQQMLAAVIESLARVSARRLDRIATNPVRIRRRVVLSGGATGGIEKLLHRDWRGRWSFVREQDATLRGLARLAEHSRV